jgi:hypothetical protein
MTPDKKKTVNGRKVEQYYWAGKNVVYIDNCLFDGTFDEAVHRVETENTQ